MWSQSVHHHLIILFLRTQEHLQSLIEAEVLKVGHARVVVESCAVQSEVGHVECCLRGVSHDSNQLSSLLSLMSERWQPLNSVRGGEVSSVALRLGRFPLSSQSHFLITFASPTRSKSLLIFFYHYLVGNISCFYWKPNTWWLRPGIMIAASTLITAITFTHLIAPITIKSRHYLG